MNLSNSEAKTVYELSKVTNINKQILDDFIASVVLAIFKDYIGSFSDPEAALAMFMGSWRSNIIKQKIHELEFLTNEQSSMSDMLLGNKIAESEDMKEFEAAVDEIQSSIIESVLGALSDGK